MRTTLYTQVLQQAAELAGRAYTDETGAVVLSGSDAIMFRTMIGQAIRRAWTNQAWPETTIHTMRRWASTWTSGQTYTRGDIVWWPTTNQYFVCVAQTTTGTPTVSWDGAVTNTPQINLWYPLADEYSADNWLVAKQYTVGDMVYVPSREQYYVLNISAGIGVSPVNGSYWAPVNPIVRRVAWDQAWESQALGDPYGVYLDNPLTTEEPREATFTWDNEGLRILDRVDAVHIHAWLPEPTFMADPATVPTRFAQYAALLGAGFMLRAEGKTDQGNELVKLGEALLEDEAGRVTRRESRSGRIHLQRR